MSIIGPYGYDRGLNTDASFVTLPKGQLSNFQNMIVNQGQLEPIPGYNTASITQPPSIALNVDLGMLGCAIAGSNYLFLMGINTTTPYVYVMSNFTGSWSSNIISSSGFAPALNDGYCIEALNGIAYLGSQVPIISSTSGGSAAKWTGSGNLASFDGPSGVGILKVVNNFLFAFAPNGTLSWSAVADGTTWPAGNSLTFKYGDGDIGTALGKIGNTLYLFKINCVGALQTTSVVLSGAVTLGPLYPVFDKIGTFGMRSIDNFPTGELVFMGTDYNVYKFDGSNLTNLSNRPYPQSSIQGSINSFINSYPSAMPSNNIWVKVNPLLNTVYVTIGGVSTQTNSTSFWAYDYVQDYWYQPGNIFTIGGYPFGDYVYLTSVGNNGAYFTSGPSNLFLGLNNFTSPSNIYSVSSNYKSFNGIPISGQTVVSIPYTFESRDTIPRSIILCYTMNGADTITITPGADGVYGSGASPTPTGNLQRTIVPVNFTDSTMTAQIQIITSTSNPYSINPLALDTEIAH